MNRTEVKLASQLNTFELHCSHFTAHPAQHLVDNLCSVHDLTSTVLTKADLTYPQLNVLHSLPHFSATAPASANSQYTWPLSSIDNFIPHIYLRSRSYDRQLTALSYNVC
jgi:hypothetical protein